MEEMIASEKIKKYEEFLNEKLAKDLEQTLEDREDVCAQTANYLQLKNAIGNIMRTREACKGNDSARLKTLVDLGCNFYAQAKIPDTSHIIVCIGMGLYLEMPLEKALDFIGEKLEHLNEKTQYLNQSAAEIKARMKLVLEGLRELQFT